MEYYFKKLRKFPFYHDKVEFEILFTCYDIMLNSRMKELSSYGFNEKEINEIIEELKNFTNQVLHDFRKISGESSLSIKKMRENRINIFSQLNKQNKTYLNKLNAAEKLLENCRDFGTLPFSTVARLAFIGTIILKSLLNKKIIDSNLYNNFMNSIDTPASKLRDDFAKFCNNKLSKQEFMEKYGKYVKHRIENIGTGLIHMQQRYFADQFPGEILDLRMSGKTIGIDEVDKKLLSILGKTARIPLVNVAKKIGISAVAVANRIRNLENKKLIMGYRPELDYTKLGYGHYRLYLNLSVASLRIIFFSVQAHRGN